MQTKPKHAVADALRKVAASLDEELEDGPGWIALGTRRSTGARYGLPERRSTRKFPR